MIQAASQAFPVTAGVKNAAEAPWGLFVAPYHAPALADAAEECLRRGPLARCADCGAYLSPHVEFDRRRWKCALCGVWNGTAATRALEDKIGRRATTRNAKTALEELRHDLVEYALPVTSKGADDSALAHPHAVGPPGRNRDPLRVPAHERAPALVFLVDERGDERFADACASLVAKAAEDLPDYYRLGLATFSDGLSLFDVASPIPHLRRTPLAASARRGVAAADVAAGSGGTALLAGAAARRRAGAAARALPEAIAAARVDATSDARCLCRAMGALLDVLFAPAAPDLAGVRVVVLLAGSETPPPPLGVGPDAADVQRLVARAAAGGVRVDARALATAPRARRCGLRGAARLATATGGAVCRHDLLALNAAAREAALEHLCDATVAPLLAPCAFECLVRVRTTPELCVDADSVFGPCRADDDLEGIWHVAGADASTCVSMTLGFTGPGGLQSKFPPVVQVAVAYTAIVAEDYDATPPLVVPPADGAGAGAAASPPPPPAALAVPPTTRRRRYWTVRRLRVCTHQFDIASSPRRIHQGLSIDAVAALLARRAVSEADDVAPTAPLAERAAAAAGARALVRDWLARFVAAAFDASSDGAGIPPGGVHHAMAEDASLSALLRVAYGLLASPLLLAAGAEDGLDDDARVERRALATSLRPGPLCQFAYPRMRGFSSVGPSDQGTADDQDAEGTRLPLARSAGVVAGAAALLVDAHAELLVYLCAPAGGSGNGTGEEPVPDDTAVEDAVHHAVETRAHPRPRVRCVRAGGSAARLYEAAMLDDAKLFDAGANKDGAGLGDFVKSCAVRVHKLLVKKKGTPWEGEPEPRMDYVHGEA